MCPNKNVHEWISVPWVHYIDLRSANGTQKEHMDLANACKAIFVEQFPVIAQALDWS